LNGDLGARLFPGRPVATATAAGADLEAALAALSAAERMLVAGAASRRLAAFALGRRAAHAALRQAGAPAAPLLAGPDRLPRWPDGFVGSISHSDGLAVAAVARAAAVPGLGIDVEAARPLEPELWVRVLRDAEQRRLRAVPEAERGLAALATFCAKEAVYKAWYPRGRRVLEFAEVEVEPPGEGRPGSARVLALPAARALLHEVRAAGYLLVGALLDPAP
jgi:4'-phosphopantetheinyl transferase EntD